jgi:hypothetical protein
MRFPKKKWSKQQLRYRRILEEIREHLSRNGMCGTIRVLRRAAPLHLSREAIRKTRDDAREISRAATHLQGKIEQTTLSAELAMRISPERARLLDTIKAIQEICEAADHSQPHEDPVRIWCAKIACTLVLRFSDKRPSSGSVRSSYRVIAGLLFEVLTGIHGCDLRRACDDELKAMRPLLAPSSH